MKEKFAVTGMTCSACSAHVEKAVQKVAGVKQAAVNLLQNSMTVEYDEAVTGAAQIINAVTAAGYGASLAERADQAVPMRQSLKSGTAPAEVSFASEMKSRLIWSIVFLAPLLYIAMGSMAGLPLPPFLAGHENAIAFGMAQLLLTLAIMYLNRSYFIKGFRSLFHGAPTMDALIAIGSGAAVVYGIFAIVRMGYGLAEGDAELVRRYHMDMYFESSGTILTLITVGKYLERRSKGRTGDAITRLLDLTPKTALVEREGTELEIPAAEVASGDILIVKAGSSIPVDGIIVEGGGAVDEAAITGESIPAEKVAGDKVTGATIAVSGYIKMKATRVGEDTTLAQIIRLVEEAGAGKAPIAKLADKVSAVFVPVVIAVAVIASVAWLIAGQPPEFALSIGIAVLVISCPCALGLATPTAIMVGTGKGAEQGILFRNAESIETAHTIDTVVLDKTGTATEGRPAVTGIYPSAGISEAELLAFAAGIEKKSEHPFASAIIERYNAEAKAGSSFPQEPEATAGNTISAITQIPGQGIRAIAEGKTIFAGNERMMKAENIDTAAFNTITEDISARGQTPLYFAKDGKLLGIISAADRIKPTSAAAVAALQQAGLNVILLSGDNERTARAIGKELGITQVIAGVLPQEKEAEVRRLREQGRKVAMVGDGINDAPALVRSDVGIAIGAGTDIAIESADIILMKSDLADAATALSLSRAVMRNIRQNLFWAFFYNVLGIPLAAGVFYSLLGWKLNPMFASAAMSLSSLFVVTNALRLNFFRPKHTMEINFARRSEEVTTEITEL